MSKWKQRINNVRVIALAHFPFSPAFDTFRLQPLTFLATFHRRVRSREGTDTLLPRNTNEWVCGDPPRQLGGLWTFVALHGSFAVSCYVNSNLRTITSLQRNSVLRSYCRFRLCILARNLVGSSHPVSATQLSSEKRVKITYME